ncbi:MAG: AAA family ATPase [Clostridiales bacterium]|nr:AAA family ATPase [Clostridiales bacterium]
MIIKKVKCDCFAGLRDRDYTFDTGLNLVIGENESGKSTLVDLLYHLFFQNTAYDGRKDNCKKFQDLYFPISTGTKGDSIDGEIRFETEERTYKLSKEWLKSKNGAEKMMLPDGTPIRDSETIKRILADVLGYGKGVYDELIFASQRRNHTILSSLLGNKTSNNIDELSKTLTKAVMETGGISIEGMEKELRETVSSYEGRWDFATDMPEGGRSHGINNPWKRDVGKILEAYYEKEKIANDRDKAEDAEREVDKINDKIREAKKELNDLKSLRERFATVRSLLSAQTANRQLKEKEEESLGKMRLALDDWPIKIAQLEKAEDLKKELKWATIKEKYGNVKPKIDRQCELQSKLGEGETVTDNDVSEAQKYLGEIQSSEAKLQGMNLSATIRKLGSTEVQVKSSVSDEQIPVVGETVDITEAINIIVPGVVDIELAPKGIDVETIFGELEKERSQLKEILKRFSVATIEELREKNNDAKELESLANTEIPYILGDMSWDDLKTKANDIPDDTRSVNDVDHDIKELCKTMTLDTFIGDVNAVCKGYENEYVSIDSLTGAIKSKEEEIDNLRSKLENADSIPKEFASVDDPEDYEDQLKGQIDQLDGEDGVLEQLRRDLSDAEKNLGEKSAEEYAEEYLQAQKEFENLKAEYVKWKHIFDVFIKVKNDARGNPLADVEKYFRENLSILSDGNLVLSNIGDNFGSKISSGNNSLTADILSDGTKDTIELAFRLAVLKHLFPDGGCVAVFDDPFTDMDPKRTAQACNLIQSFAENNQVIFVSCDEKYLDSMAGNVIRISR